MISGGVRSRGRSKSSPHPSDVAAHSQPVFSVEFTQAIKAIDVLHVFVA